MATHKPRTIFLLRLLQLNIYHLLVEQLRALKMTPLQYMVLSILSSRGTWSTAALARRFHIAPQSMNEVVASLEKSKLIARSKSAVHGRVLTIRLTASGLRRLEKCNKEVDQIERAAFAEFAADELDQFRGLMSRALEKFSAPAPRPAPATASSRTPPPSRRRSPPRPELHA